MIIMNTCYIPYPSVVYQLEGYVISEPENASYPEFEIELYERILYKTQPEAELKVKELAGQEDTSIVILGDSASGLIRQTANSIPQVQCPALRI